MVKIIVLNPSFKLATKSCCLYLKVPYLYPLLVTLAFVIFVKIGLVEYLVDITVQSMVNLNRDMGLIRIIISNR